MAIKAILQCVEWKVFVKQNLKTRGYPKVASGTIHQTARHIDCRKSSIITESQKTEEADVYSMDVLLMPDIILNCSQ